MRSPALRFGSISVVIPAYRAEDCIAATLDDVQAWLDAAGLEHEVIVVSDASPDRTADVVRERGRGVRLLAAETNRGKGDSVRRGMLDATKRWAVFTDADNSTAISHLERFAGHEEQADMIIASRFAPGAEIVRPRPALRRAMGAVFPAIINTLMPTGVRDTQCGFKAFRMSRARRLFELQSVDGFAFDVELLLLARRMGLRIAEVPIRWDNPDESTVRAPVEAMKMLRQAAGAAKRVRSLPGSTFERAD